MVTAPAGLLETLQVLLSNLNHDYANLQTNNNNNNPRNNNKKFSSGD